MVYEQEYARNEIIAVGTSNVLISDMKKRKMVYLRNTSSGTQVITIRFDNVEPAVANKGIVLSVGEVCVDASSEGYEAWNGKIQAISSAINGQLTIVER